MKNQNITYVFERGRKSKLSEIDSSKEFFYGYHYFVNEFKNVNLIELKGSDHKNSNLWFFIDKILVKISNLPFHFSRIEKKKMYKDLINSNIVIFTNERSAMSSLLTFRKIKKKKEINSLVIVMGLFVKPKKTIFQKVFQKVFIKIFLKVFDNIVFLSRTEYGIAKKNYSKFQRKFHYLPFSVDTKFWKLDENIDFSKKDKLLFIGNDGRRDFNKIIEIAKQLTEYNFLFVTDKISNQELKSDNVQLIQGHWNLNILTDLQIKEIYSEAKVSIIPLKNSLQPSGQSVAQQSMAMGVPVLISKTEGFWDFKNYKNNFNIVFQEDEEINSWVKTIRKLYNDNQKLEEISKNGLSLIKETNNLENFYINLKEILNLN